MEIPHYNSDCCETSSRIKAVPTHQHTVALTGGSRHTYVNAIYGVERLASYDTIVLPCYVLYFSFTLGISEINDSEYMQIRGFFVLGVKHKNKSNHLYTGVPGGMVNILGGHSIGHSKQKKCIHVSYSERFLRFHSSVAKLLIRKRYYIPFLITYLLTYSMVQSPS